MPGKLIVDEIEDSGGTSVIGRKNYIINGNFDIWQRGTSGTSGYCSADRWYFGTSGATGTLAQGSFTAGQTDVPNNPKYYANLTTTVADDNTNILQRIEDVYTLAGETITISFWAKHTTNAPTSFLIKTRQYFGSGGSTAVVINSSAQTTTTSWQKYTHTVTLGSISGKTIGSDSRLELEISNPNNEIFDLQIAQVQVEKGSVATDFEVRPIGEELSLCQRYYEKSYSIEDTPGSSTYDGIYNVSFSANGNSDSVVSIRFKVEKRTSPTVTGYTFAGTVGNWTYYRSGVSPTSGTITIDRQCTSSARLYVAVGAAWVACDLWGHWVADAEL